MGMLGISTPQSSLQARRPLVQLTESFLDLLPAFRSPTQVWALPVAFRLDRNRQGLTKGRKGKKPPPPPDHRPRPARAVERLPLFSSWFPERSILVSGDSAYGAFAVRLNKCET